MKLNIPENVYKILNIKPGVSNQEILRAINLKMQQDPKKMKVYASYQRLLLDPKSRFLIEFLYYLKID